MQITDVRTTRFRCISRTQRDTDGHGHPGPERESTQTLLQIDTDQGVSGYWFGANASVMESVIKPAIVGRDPFFREEIWHDLNERQRLNMGTMSDKVLTSVDLALWDLAGRALDIPVYKMLGGYRDRVPAYSSTMCGDDLENGLATPEDYAKFAEWSMQRGYQAFKLHTWQPPYEGAPSTRRDLEACAAVREAVGPDIPCMLDPYHYYDREAALYLAKALEELGYYWMEEPMDEHSTSSYVWLTQQLDIPILGPESPEGKMRTRAEWIVRNASDITRAGVSDVGGIGPTLKVAHLAESFGMACEIHGGGAGNLHVTGSMWNGRWYERGLLHPFVDYEEPDPWLNSIVDPMDGEGFVKLPLSPGLGEDVNFEFITENLIETR